MSRLSGRPTCRTAVVASLILAVLVRVPSADGLLLHDHSDHGVHAHTVTLDDLRDFDPHGAWHRHHDEEPDDRNNDSDVSECVDLLFIFINVPALATGVHCSSGAVVASIQQSSSKILPWSMLPSDPKATAGLSRTPRPSAPPLRPAFALDALLQSSHALLL